MAARSKPNWAHFEGGPLDGTRRIIHPNIGLGEFIQTMDSGAPGMLTPMVYRLTAEARTADTVWASKSRVAVYVRTLPDVVKPQPRFGHFPAHVGPDGPLSG